MNNQSPYIEITRLARGLDNIPRFSNQPRIKDETVAAHSYYVALMVFMITTELEELGCAVDVGKCIQMALLHDLPETVTGDIIYPVKKHDSENMGILDKLEEQMMAEAIPDTLPRCLKKLLIPEKDYPGKWSVEIGLVKFCDMCELVFYAMAERRMGNQNFSHFIGKGLHYCHDIIIDSGFLLRSPMVKDMVLGLATEAFEFPEIEDLMAAIEHELEQIKWNL
jgi:5'-deoxynucleotidase YfbR-like HD superfamily hydrolase